MKLVEWPQSPEISTGDPGVSWMELVLSFVAWSHGMVPLPEKNAAMFKRGMPSNCLELATGRTAPGGVGELSNSFSILISQVRRLHGIDPWPERSHGFVKPIFLLGSMVQSYGVKQRPAFPAQDVVS